MRQHGCLLAWIAGAALACPACVRPTVMTKTDYLYYNQISGAYEPGRYGDDAPPATTKPRSVLEPTTAERWALTMEAAKRLALENNKQIRVLRYQPGIAGTSVDTELAAFDAFFEMGGGWGETDRQVANLVQTFGSAQNALRQNLFGGAAGFGRNTTTGAATQDGGGGVPGDNLIGFSKRNAAGGTTSINYALSYSRANPISVFTAVNPTWTSEVRLGIEQPLLQGAGVEFNRSRILIARAQQQLAVRDFDTNVQTLLRDVEIAYWQLYFSYQDLYSRETAMKQALVTWQNEASKLEIGTASAPDVAQARQQYELFRAARLQSLNGVLAADRSLRNLLGLAPDDGRQIVPQDEPVTTEYKPDWDVAVLEAMENRPDLSSQRFAIRAAEIELARQKNGLLPDLTVNASYIISGLDNQFDQSIDRLTDNQFNDWFLGIRYRRQIGERAANAATRRAQLTLSRERARLQNLEHTIIHDLHAAYQNLIANYAVIQAEVDRRLAAARQLQGREDLYRQGSTTIDLVLQAQADFANALRDESLAIVQYNQALAQWEFAKGTMLINDNVTLAEATTDSRGRFLEQRRKQWRSSLPLPLHPGSQVHDDPCFAPDPLGPLYPVEITAPGPAGSPPTTALPNPPAAEPVTTRLAPARNVGAGALRGPAPAAPRRVQLPGIITDGRAPAFSPSPRDTALPGEPTDWADAIEAEAQPIPSRIPEAVPVLSQGLTPTRHR